MMMNVEDHHHGDNDNYDHDDNDDDHHHRDDVDDHDDVCAGKTAQRQQWKLTRVSIRLGPFYILLLLVRFLTKSISLNPIRYTFFFLIY